MKLKENIRNKLRLWLFKNDLLQIEASKKVYKDAANTYKNSCKLVEDCHKMMNSMIDVGVDVGFYSEDHSWAVVCIKGHPEYVKFLPLSHKDTCEVIEFLKRFRYSNRVIDSPFAFRDMVDHCIMDNPFEK